jgi:hypothetical protein
MNEYKQTGHISPPYALFLFCGCLCFMLFFDENGTGESSELTDTNRIDQHFPIRTIAPSPPVLNQPYHMNDTSALTDRPFRDKSDLVNQKTRTQLRELAPDGEE